MTYNDLRNEDWPKVMAWDLPRNLHEFLSSIAGTGDPRAAVDRFMASPAWEAIPQDLKDQVLEFHQAKKGDTDAG